MYSSRIDILKFMDIDLIENIFLCSIKQLLDIIPNLIGIWPCLKLDSREVEMNIVVHKIMSSLSF